MSEEEKEAIENIKALKILFEIDDKKDFEATPLVQKEMAKDLRTLLNLIEKLLKENEKLKEYIAIAPNLDEMTATKYRNIRQDAYIQGRAEEQQKAEQIIYENYISVQKIKDKIEELSKTKGDLATHIAVSERIRALQELLEESEEN